jgi:phosphoribosylformimino-5-aminoimidazole carboxamide ribonucleotide (ProFAR) isomerase
MTKFRPCIDLHSGQVKQIVGGTLNTASADLKTNYVSNLPAGHFARLYKDNGLDGAHVIMLGPGNEEAAREALTAWPRGLQVGGGITDQNAKQWIEWGAERVSWDEARNCSRDGLMLIEVVGHYNLFLVSFWQVLARTPRFCARSYRQRQGEACH